MAAVEVAYILLVVAGERLEAVLHILFHRKRVR
jgi:hypothetical protein